jgi:hypothetical protein
MNILLAAQLTPDVDKTIEDMFTYQSWGMDKIQKGNVVRDALASAVRKIIEVVPPGPDRTVAIRKIREARMDCNSAITFDGRY